MKTTTLLHIATTAPEGIKVRLCINHETETAEAQCTDSLGTWTKAFASLWECCSWLHSFGKVTPLCTTGDWTYRGVFYSAYKGYARARTAARLAAQGGAA